MRPPIDPGQYDFVLPKEAIAQRPAASRANSRLMVIPRVDGPLGHSHFHQLPELLPAGSVLVVNDTRVIPARLVGTRSTGGRAEVFLLNPLSPGGSRWQAWVKPSSRVRPGMKISLGGGLVATAIGRVSDKWEVELSGPGELDELIGAHGQMPLPPYIRRQADAEDTDRYQTVFADEAGAVAAPTAGLHFTPELIETLKSRGFGFERLTLHVGAGTFAPLRAEQLESRSLHPERYAVGREVWQRLVAAKAAGRPIVAVGTTVVRTLESVWQGDGQPALSGQTRLFITPGFRFRMVDHLITNFHLPRSSLLMLVAALTGRQRLLSAYGQAVQLGYRFYSYGDATLIF